MTKVLPKFSLKPKFTTVDVDGNSVALFDNKTEFNNFKIVLERLGGKFKTSKRKKTKKAQCVVDDHPDI